MKRRNEKLEANEAVVLEELRKMHHGLWVRRRIGADGLNKHQSAYVKRLERRLTPKGRMAYREEVSRLDDRERAFELERGGGPNDGGGS
jgi:hypothetical protein